MPVTCPRCGSPFNIHENEESPRVCPYCGQILETPDSNDPPQSNDSGTDVDYGLKSRTELPVGQNIAGVSNTRSVHLQMKMFVFRKIYDILKKSRQSPKPDSFGLRVLLFVRQ